MFAHAMTSTIAVMPMSRSSGVSHALIDRALAARAFHDAELLRAKALERLGAHALLQLRLDVVDDRLVERVHPAARRSMDTPGLSRANR